MRSNAMLPSSRRNTIRTRLNGTTDPAPASTDANGPGNSVRNDRPCAKRVPMPFSGPVISRPHESSEAAKSAPTAAARRHGVREGVEEVVFIAFYSGAGSGIP